MARTVPTTEPTILVAGDSWSWTKTLSNYPPSEGWTLGYAIRGASTLANTDVVTTTSGAGYSISVDKIKTAVLTPGTYQWYSFVDNAGTGEHYTVETGVITVLANLSSLSGSQGQQHAERTLAIITAAIENRLTGDFEHYTIGNRQIQKIPIKELVRLRAVYQAKVYRYQNPGQLGPQIVAQMSNPDGSSGTAAPVVLPPWFRSQSS